MTENCKIFIKNCRNSRKMYQKVPMNLQVVSKACPQINKTQSKQLNHNWSQLTTEFCDPWLDWLVAMSQQKCSINWKPMVIKSADH